MSTTVPGALTAYREAVKNGLCQLPGKAPDVWTILCLKWYNEKKGLASPGLRNLAEDLYGPLLPGPEVTYTDRHGVVRPSWLRKITSLRRALTCLERRGWVKKVLKPTQGRATGYALFSSPCPESDREDAAPCPETSASLSIPATTTPFERPMVYGVPRRNVEAAETDRDRRDGIRIPNIKLEDLTDSFRLFALFDLCAEVVGTSDAARLDFVACARVSLRKAKTNPGGFFADRLRNWSERRGWITMEDEEYARHLLQEADGG
jgi:hypothetical protein